MKIVLFAQNMYSPWIEGIKNNSFFLSTELQKHLDLLIVSHLPRDPEKNKKADNLNVHYLLRSSDNKFIQSFYFILGAFKSWYFIFTNNVNIVLFQYLEISFILPMFLLSLFSWKTSFIVTLYSTDELNHWYKKLTLRLLRFKIKKIVIISEYLRDGVRKLGYQDSDIVYIPLSYDTSRYLHLADFSKRNNRTILFSAGPTQAAGSFFMTDLAREMPDYNFIFAMRQFNKRSEDELKLLTDYIQEKGVNNITILRNVEKMENLLDEVGALVLALQDINIKMLIPVALLEAMARGTICFVSDFPNLELLVEDGKNAIVFKKTDLFDLKEKIDIFISREDISLEAYNFGKNFPDYPKIGEMYLNLINNL